MVKRKGRGGKSVRMCTHEKVLVQKESFFCTELSCRVLIVPPAVRGNNTCEGLLFAEQDCREYLYGNIPFHRFMEQKKERQDD